MDPTELKKELTETLKKIFQDFTESEEYYKKKFTHFEKWDSLTQMELVGTIEEKFGIDIDLEEFIDVDCADSLLNLIKKKVM